MGAEAFRSPGCRGLGAVPATAAPMIVGLFHEIDEGRATAMAESKSMTIEQVVRELMAGEHADVLRESVRLVVKELMNAEVSELIGAAHGERNPEGRMIGSPSATATGAVSGTPGWG
jgi:hypothetical protein